ncbi:MAG: hypothetical protein JWO51_3543 [Rhodospirillales bacterium]|nr:hypothetical protein [Rhodospirillales bacterium]
MTSVESILMLAQNVQRLSARIAALEASQCHCHDCETHREKASASSRANVAAEARRKVGT